MSRRPETVAAVTLLLLALAAAPAFADTNTVTNNTPVGFCAGKNASQFPSTVDVAGMAGTIDKVAVQLASYQTASPALDLLLVSPAGKTVLIMSDVISAAPVNVGLDDGAAGLLPTSDPLAGLYKPTDIDLGLTDLFSAPAPGEPYGTSLSTLNGDDANGTWSLYAAENPIGGLPGCIADGGLASWALEITTKVADIVPPPPPPPPLDPTTLLPLPANPLPVQLPIQAPPASTPDSAPMVDSAGFTSPLVVGEPSTLRVVASAKRSAVTGLIVDFGEQLGRYAASACRIGQSSRGGTATFDVPYTYSAAGDHTIQMTTISGGCGKAKTSKTTTSVNVAPALGLRAARIPASHAADTLPGPAITTACAHADLAPTPSNGPAIIAAILCIVNEQRALHKLKPLRTNGKLKRAAVAHTQAMVSGSFFAHQGPREPSLLARLRKARYRYPGGENIGAGLGALASPLLMVNGWMHSKLHRANVLSKSWRAVGMGYVAQFPLAQGEPAATYTSDFGSKG